MRSWPRCAGGFIWAYADEGVVRTDLNNMIDNVGNYGADGIVGPHHEKEGNYYTVKQIWSPVQVFMPEDFNGTLNVENRYNFLSLDKGLSSIVGVTYTPDDPKVADDYVILQGEVANTSELFNVDESSSWRNYYDNEYRDALHQAVNGDMTAEEALTGFAEMLSRKSGSWARYFSFALRSA